METMTTKVKTTQESAKFGIEPDASPERRAMFRPAMGAIWQFGRYMITLPVALLRGRAARRDEVVVYAAHPSFFLWLLIVVGFASAVIVSHDPQWAVALGWLYVWVLVYFLVTVLYDVSTRKLALWALIFMFIWLASKYVEHIKDVALLGSVVNYLANLEPTLDAGTVTVLSWLLLLPWIGALLHMALNGRKKFTPNEIGEFHFGEGSELTDRSGLRFRTRYRDVLETLLTFGGGDLIAVDNHQNVIKRWDNIIGLFFYWNALDRILHQRAAVMELDRGEQTETVA